MGAAMGLLPEGSAAAWPPPLEGCGRENHIFVLVSCVLAADSTVPPLPSHPHPLVAAPPYL
jgi:hypothetical protein